MSNKLPFALYTREYLKPSGEDESLITIKRWAMREPGLDRYMILETKGKRGFRFLGDGVSNVVEPGDSVELDAVLQGFIDFEHEAVANGYRETLSSRFRVMAMLPLFPTPQHIIPAARHYRDYMAEAGLKIKPGVPERSALIP